MALLPPPPRANPATAGQPANTGGEGGAFKREPEIVVIPEKFYGVALKQKVTEAPPPPPPPKPVAKLTPVPVASPTTVPRHPGLWVAFGVVLFVAAIGGGFVYFNRKTLFQKAAPPPPTPSLIATPSAPANLTASLAGSGISLVWVDASGNETGYRIERKEEEGTFLPLTNLAGNSTVFLDTSVQPGKAYSYRAVAVNESGEAVSNEVTASTQPAAPLVPLTPALPPSGLDSDSDGLSDVEEEAFTTDFHHPDTDRDGFLDGNEVFHLYNPAAKAPIRLLDSGVTQPWKASSGWRVLVPVKWTAAFDLPDGSRATLDTKHGEKFFLTIEENPQRLPLIEWYLSNHPGASSVLIKSVTTKGGLEGVLGVDRLDAYFSWGDRIFSFRYDMAGQPFVNFRTTFEMMLNSLILTGAPTLSAPTMERLSGPGSLVVGGGATSTQEATTTLPIP